MRRRVLNCMSALKDFGLYRRRFPCRTFKKFVFELSVSKSISNEQTFGTGEQPYASQAKLNLNVILRKTVVNGSPVAEYGK